MSDPMAEIRASFFIECEELLEGLQDGLQMMDDGESDDETINIVFRAVHSIKGGAGAFGLDDLVHFAHKFETAMDEVRAGRFTPDAAALKLFFQCADILADLVRAARDEEVVDDAVTAPVLKALEDLVGLEEEEENVEFEVTGIALDLPPLDATDAPDGLPPLPPLDATAPELPPLPPLNLEAGPEDETVQETGETYKIVFKPEDSLFASGNEPIYLFKTLRDLGDVVVKCITGNLPEFGQLDPEKGFLSWELQLTTEESEQAIREVFEFVDGLCTLEISKSERPAEAASSAPPEAILDTASSLPVPPQEPPIPDPIAEAPEAPQVVAEPKAEAPPVAPAPKPVSAPPAEPVSEKPGKSSSPKSESKASSATQPRATVRVDLERIDRLVNLVGELVINQAMLSQSVAEAGLPPNSAVATGLEEFMQLTRDIQESVMMIRAQPIKSLFQRMGRIVRESSAAVNKDVRLHTEGENTEVDKTVIERLADPLTHMIRNAVDHGLESTEDRIAAGKTEQGLVSLTASHRSGRILIEVSDDGGGINRPKVRQIAIDKGLIPEDAQLSDGDIDNLLFLPGFSTASEISNLSGRGVGMDVVKSSIQALGGRISITSEPGVGTTFSISLPLTLAVLDGMVVKVDEETIVVPLNAILETLTLTDEDLRALGPSTHVVQIRGGFVPLLDLGAELGYRSPKDSYVGGVVLLIGQEDGNRAALVVDAIEDQRQVVIKGLEASYGRVPGIAAATILGDGQIALILDPADLVSQASGRTRVPGASLAKVG